MAPGRCGTKAAKAPAKSRCGTAAKKTAAAKVKCPGCGAKVEKKVRAGCKTMKCPSCGGRIPVA